MTQDEIIRMARDIDGHLNDHARGIDMSWETLVEIVQTAVLAEREACAKVCEEEAASWAKLNAQDEEGYGAIQCAAAIRARNTQLNQ